MGYSLRLFMRGDADALHQLTLAAIESIGPAGYSQEQVDAWATRHGSAERLITRAAEGHKIFVVVDDADHAVAYSLLEPDGHLDMLYCHPEHTRRGLADRVLSAAEEHAAANGIAKLYTEASELAHPAFERAGYAVTHRRDFDIDGTPIHNFAMEKVL